MSINTIWTGSEISSETGGKWISGQPENVICTGVSFFVNRTQSGDLFILTNPKVWGKDYTDSSQDAPKIIANGAKAIITEKKLPNVPNTFPVLLVDDTYKALWALARYARKRFKGKIIAVTGSVGKSTTKEGLYHVLQKQGKAFRTMGNFNCQRGLPLSLAQAPENCEYVVLESSLSYHGGSLRKAELVKPHVAIITDIQPDHLQFCNSLEEIADNKAKLFDALEPNGTAIINGENAYSERLKNHALEVGVKNIIIYGDHPESTVRALDYKLGAYSTFVKAKINDIVVDYTLSIVGKHAVKNSLGILAAVQAVGADVYQAAKDLESFKTMAKHTQLEEIPFKKGVFHLIDDSYSANPASVKSGCEYANIVGKEFNSRVIVILGDMQELGAASPQLHAELAPVLIENNIYKAFLIGKDMHNLWVNLPASMQGAYENDAKALCRAIFKVLEENDTVLIKTSARTYELIPIINALRKPNEYLKEEAKQHFTFAQAPDFKFLDVDCRDQKTCRLLFVGDTSPGENYQQQLARKGNINILESKGYDYPLYKVNNALKQADVVIANLETPLTNLRKSPYEDKKSYVHWSDIQKTPECLLKHNIKVVSMANNHAYDYGDAGFRQTLSVLKENNIQYFGGGYNESEADLPLIIKIKFDAKKPIHIALLGAFTEVESYRKVYGTYATENKSGVASLSLKKIENAVTKLRKFDPNIYVILFPHWGDNYKWKSKDQSALAKKLIEVGADFIVGHGAHMLQEIEKIDNRWVVYSLGNFVFNSPGRYKRLNAPPYSLMLNLQVESQHQDVLIKPRVYPILTDNLQTNYQTRPVNENEFDNVCALLTTHNESKTTYLNVLKREKDKQGYYLELPSEYLSSQMVGLVSAIDKNKDPMDPDQFWRYRAYVINKLLKSRNLKLFSFSPDRVNYSSRKCEGYIIDDDNNCIKMISSIPLVNYSWFLSSDPQMLRSHQKFIAFCKQAGIQYYPKKSLVELFEKNGLDSIKEKFNRSLPEVKNYWFEDIESPLTITPELFDQLLKLIEDSIRSKIFKFSNIPEMLSTNLSPRIIFISLSDSKFITTKTLGSGLGLLNAINDALAQIAITDQQGDISTLKLDIVQSVKKIEHHNWEKSVDFDRSLYGIAFTSEHREAFLPEEIISYNLINNQNTLRPQKIVKMAALSENKQQAFLEKELTFYQFSVSSGFLSLDDKGLMYRGHRLFNKVVKQDVLSSIHHAADYLKSAIKKDGSFLYEYLPKQDEESGRYNILRHAGTIYAMLEYYEMFPNETLLAAIKKTLSYLLNKAKPITIQGDEVLCIVEKGFVKLGANALTLLAVAKYSLLTKDLSYKEIGVKLALWIKHAQKASGKFIIQKMKLEERKNTKFISDYYPGEAIFALLSFYKIDPNPLWLDIAQKAAEYLIKVRDKDKKISQLYHDHWLLYGLNELYRFRQEKAYLKQSERICRAIIQSQFTKENPPDYLGSFYNPPRSTPGAIRAEGMCAAFRLLSDFQQKDYIEEIRKAILLSIRFQLQTQFDRVRSMYLKNPQRALGGFSRSLTDFGIRIDYVQHNLSSLIALFNIIEAEK